MIPLHPEKVAGRPDRLRWMVPVGTVDLCGPVAVVPGALGDLVAAGVLASVAVEPDAVVLTLGPGHDWGRDGPRVRTALHAALADPSGWVPAPGAVRLGADALLARRAHDVLAGPAGDYVRSHGGGVELVDARDGIVRVRLSGACRGCSAVAFTVGTHLERALRAAYPALKALRAM